MKFWLDTEFNEMGGALISMALVSQDGREWYEILQCNDPTPWVHEHVIPFLGSGTSQCQLLSIDSLSLSLQAFLSAFDSAHIIADWPDDISYFCRALIVGPGQKINTPPISFEIIDVDYVSAIPHNALSDARAIRDALAKRDAERYMRRVK